MRKKLAVWFGMLLLLVCFVTGCEKSLEEQIAEQLELGQKYLSELNYEEAIVAFTKAIELEEKTEVAYIGLAEAYEGKGDVWQATQILETGYELFPEGDMKNSLAETYKRALEFFAEDMERQRKIYDRLIELFPEDSSICEQLIQFYQKTGDLDELEKLTEMDQSRITDEAVLTELERIKTALEAIQKITDACEAGEIDLVFEFMNSEEFAVLQQFAEEMEMQVFMAENGKGLGIYPVKTENYGESMIYYGDYQDGKRQGHGLWMGSKDGKKYWAEGEWRDDKPNGSHEARWRWSSSDGNLINRMITGAVEDGFWNGEALYIFEEQERNRKFPISFEHGKYIVLDITEDMNGMVLYVVSVSGTPDEYGEPGSMVIHDPDELEGIEGFLIS